MSGQNMRQVLLEVIAEYSPQGAGMFQSRVVLEETSRRLGGYGMDTGRQQAILTLFGDLFRSGYLGWGHNITNPDPPFMHLTEAGRQALRHLSRDPANPDGYLAYLDRQASIGPVARSYIEEALQTYSSNCFKAAAVMTGAAAESMVLRLRDVLLKRFDDLGRAPPKGLADWQVKRAVDALQHALGQQKAAMPQKLRDDFEAYWPAFVQQIRVARNEAGHPSSLNPVTPETVHGLLLIFPALAKVSAELEAWIAIGFA